MLLSRAFEPPDLLVTTITGALTTRDQIEFVAWVREHIRTVGSVRVLVRLDGFAGWQPNAFDDPAGWLADDELIAGLALVGDPRWRLRLLTAMAQPVRRTPIVYVDTEADARDWLASVPERTRSITT
jgi:hypothetical protein